MAVKIRLRRMGQKKAPYYRIIVADSRSPRDGRCIEEIGTYDPSTDPSTYQIDAEKAKNAKYPLLKHLLSLPPLGHRKQVGCLTAVGHSLRRVVRCRGWDV